MGDMGRPQERMEGEDGGGGAGRRGAGSTLLFLLSCSSYALSHVLLTLISW